MPVGSVNAPLPLILTSPLPGTILKSLLVLIVEPLISNVSMIIDPVPLALSSKSLLLIVVVMKLSSIKISPVLKLFAVIVPVLVMFPTVIVPLTSKLFSIITSLLGMLIIPAPLARNSKFELVSVVLIVLPTICKSSNCIRLALIITSPVTSKLPVKLISPTCVTLPVCVIVPLTTVCLVYYYRLQLNYC